MVGCKGGCERKEGNSKLYSFCKRMSAALMTTRESMVSVLHAQAVCERKRRDGDFVCQRNSDVSYKKSVQLLGMWKHLQLPLRYAIALKESNRLRQEMTTPDASVGAATCAVSVDEGAADMQPGVPPEIAPRCAK